MTKPAPRHLEEKLQRELEPGERVEWKGTPIPHYFNAATTSLFLFSIPWTAFAVFWMFGASSQSGSVPFTLLGLPFVLIGLALFSSPIWNYKKSINTIYAITDSRAITIDGGWTTTYRSYTPSDLKFIYRKERSDRSGDVILSRREWRDSDGDKQNQELGFLRIQDPKAIESKLKKLAKTTTHERE